MSSQFALPSGFKALPDDFKSVEDKAAPALPSGFKALPDDFRPIGAAAVPGMEQLGGVPPGPPKPPNVIPSPRPRSSIEMSMGGMAGSAGAPPETFGPTAQGLLKMGSGVENVVRELSPNIGRTQLAGMGQKQPGKPEGDLRKAAQGAADIITGGFETAAPLVAPAAVAAPLTTLAMLGLASLADVATSKGMKAMGVPEEYANLGGAVAALLAGGKFGHEALTKIHEALGSPEVKIGGKFETPKDFQDMTDTELVGHANKIEAERPKNYRWQKEQIVQEAARRQAERGMAAPEPGPQDVTAPPLPPEFKPIESKVPERIPPNTPQQSSQTAPVPPTEVVSQSAPEVRNAEPTPASAIPVKQPVAGTPESPTGIPPSAPASEPAPAVPPAQTAEPSAVVPAPVEQVPSAIPGKEAVQPESESKDTAEAKGAPPEQAAPQITSIPPGSKTSSPTPETAAETPQASPSKPAAGSAKTESARGGEGEPGWIGNVPRESVLVDAPRFQFKQNVGQGGAGDEFKGVTKWDPEKAGILSVWKDPANGKTYAVNGHHRVDMANHVDEPPDVLPVRYLDAATAQEARTKGALINISEGHGESTDAAKVFRDMQLSPEKEAEFSRELGKGRIATEGLALSKLAQPIFDDVMRGVLSPARGAVIGANLPEHVDQTALYDLMKAREKSGKRLTNDQIGELIRLTNEAPKQTETQDSLFGSEEMTRSLLPEKAEVSDYVRKQLGTERKLFGVVSTQAAAEKLGEAGNVIKTGENAQQAERANQGVLLYDKLSTKSGPIADALDQAARSIADGENASEVKQRTYKQIRTALRAQADQLSGVPRVSPEGNKGVQGGGRAAEGAPDIEGFRPVKKQPLPSESLFGSESEDQSKADTQSYEDRLLGDQLTAQFRSGLAAKPTKLKPLQNRGLFDEEGPEQEGLSFEGYRPIPGFYSGLERAIEAKMPEKASASQVDGIVKNPQNGIKPDELKWSGFGEWLAQQKGPITKQQVTEFIRQNNVQVEEVVHGEKPEPYPIEWQQESPDLWVSRGNFKPGEAIGGRFEVRGPHYKGHDWDGFQVYDSRERKVIGGDFQSLDAAQLAAGQSLGKELNAAPPTKFEQYVLPGGQNYRELLLTLPVKPAAKEDHQWKKTNDGKWAWFDGNIQISGAFPRESDRGYAFPTISPLKDSAVYKSPHWDEPNVLAHIRFDDRTGPGGEKILHVAEIQSDWHQAGRKKGYLPSVKDRESRVAEIGKQLDTIYRDALSRKHPPEMVDIMRTAEIQPFNRDMTADEISRAQDLMGERARLQNGGNGVPDAPFQKTWPELAFRRILRYGAEHGYDKLTWDTGETSAARYDLSKQVKSIEWLPRSEEGERQVTINPKDGNPIEFIVGSDGVVAGFQGPGSGGEFDGKHITDVVGKEIGDQILTDKSGDLSGNGLKVGGEGMKGFYDQILPAYANKYAKKWGAKVAETELPGGSKNRQAKLSPEKMTELHALLKQEDYLGFDTGAGARLAIAQSPDWQNRWEIESPRLKELLTEYHAIQNPPVKVHAVNITPAMRESVMAGQPLFYAPPEIPRIDASVRSEPFVTQAPFRFHAKMARMSPIPLEGRISGIADAFVVNPSAMEIVGRAAGRPADQTGPAFAGLHLAPRDAGLVARNIGMLAPQLAETGRSDIPQPVQDLYEALRDASESGKSIVLVSDHPAFEQYQDAAMAEELSHAVQAQVTGKTKTHLGSGLEAFTSSPTYQKAAGDLRSRYGDLDPNGGQEATEVGVRLMRPDGYKEMGLSPQEARSLAASYVQALRRAHGSQSPKQIAAEVFAAFRKTERGTAKSGDGAVGPVARRGGGDGESAGPDLSGYKPPKGREPDERQPRDVGAETAADKGAPKGLIARSLLGKLSGLFHGYPEPSIPQEVKPDWVREVEEQLGLAAPKPVLPENSHQVYDTETGRIRDHGLTEKEARKSAKSFTDLSGTEHAHRQVDTRPEPTEEFPHETKESKLAQGVEKNAIAEGLTEGFEGRPEYRTVNVKEQAKLAADLIAQDLPKAISVAMGDAVPPGELLPESVFVAVENYATEHGNVELLRQLAESSSLSMEATGMGQRIRMLGERRRNSPVAVMQEVVSARETAAAKKHGPKAKSKIKAEMKESIKQQNKRKDPWTALMEEWKCR